MPLYLASLLAFIGIAGYVALHYAWIGQHWREARTHRFFAALAAVLAVHGLCNATFQYDPAWAQAHGCDLITSLSEFSAAALLVGFVARFTGQDQRPIRLALTTALGLLAIATVLLPHGTRSGPISGMEITSLPWGETVRLTVAPYGTVYFLMLVVSAACFVFCGVAAWRAWRTGRAGRQLALLLSLGIIVLAVANSVIADLANWPTVPLIDHSFILLIAIMGHTLSSDLARAAELEARLRRSEQFAAVGRLAGGVAHDFGNILTGVLGHSELLVDRLKDDPTARDQARAIATAAGRGAALTRQLLAFARGSPTNATQSGADAHAVLAEVAGLIRSGAAGIEVRLERDPAGGVVAGDPTRLHAALLNLAMNARDAMPRGGVLRLTTTRREPPPGIKLRHTPAPGPLLEIAVSDTGQGIPSAVLPRIFDLQFSTKGELGTGLGLTQVDEMAQAAGGCLAVETSPGRGTTFRIWLPLREEVGSGLHAADGSRVLLAAGNSSLDQVLASCLGQLGYEITRLGSDDPVHLFAAVVDIDHAGDEGLARIRALQDRLPVVVLADDPTQWPAAECTIILPKPADLRALGSALRKAGEAGRRRTTHEAPTIPRR